MRRFRSVLFLFLASIGVFASPAAHAWWNDDWAFRKEITLDLSPTGAAIPASLTGVPVLVRLSLGNFAYFNDTKADGSDLRFIASDDKTPLKFHIERYDAQAQMAFVWVTVPRLTAGVNTDKVQQWGHGSLSTWAIGNDLDDRQWRGVFRQLVAGGLLEADVEHHGALRLTAASGPVLRGEVELRFRHEPAKPARRRRSRDGGTVAPMVDLDPESQVRFDALREWRANTAREQNVPAYVIFHDSTLRAIAEAAPDDLDELARVPGIGATKLDRYGEAVLQRLFDAA